ncbi:MAG: hypothetical protein Q7S10_03525 [bacterium]|nr:hypothetical protein [bacterium]
MTKIIFDDYLVKKLAKLPKDVFKIYKKQERIFTENWLDSRLHTKKLIGVNWYSFRVTRNYRVLFYFQDVDVVVFTDIGHRKDIYE